MAEPTNTIKAREARAQRIIEKLRYYYALGQKAANRKTNEDRHANTAFANRKGVTSDTVRKAQQFVEYYTPRDLDELCQLRKPEPDGLPLNWAAYVLQLLRIPDAKVRKRLQTQAAKEGLTGPELRAVISPILAKMSSKRLSSKQRQGGRKFKRPASPEALLSQLIMAAEYWNRRFDKGWTVGGHLDLNGLIDQAGKRTAADLSGRLRRAREALTRVQATAEQAKAELQRLERRLKRFKS